MSRAGAGTRVSVGRLRVDAARAVDKLREYQLPDGRMWILEVLRAAVASGATRVRVTGDADDVRVAWEGPAPAPEELTRLFDELVDPAPAPARRPLRLLATGVNTALGIGPRFVDVFACAEDGEAHRVRYTPGLLDTGDGAVAEGLRELRAEPVVPPPEAPPRGGLVHLRRLPLWSAVPILVGFAEPDELGLVRRCADDLKVPIEVGRAELSAARSHGDLLRLSLDEGLDGFLAIVDPTFAELEARLDVAELGVLLSRYVWPLEGFEGPRAPVPLRLFVDAERMPTNASRSAVRLEAPPVSDAMAQGRARLGELTARLAKELGDAPEHAWEAAPRTRLRAAALGLLGARVAGEGWRRRLRGRPGAPLPEVLAPLAELPLLRDALGRPRSPASFPVDRGEAWVHFGADPLPARLEPWLGDVLWVPPGDPARVLLGRWVPPRADAYAERARSYLAARDAFLEASAEPAELARSRAQLLMVPIRTPGRSLKSCVPPSWLALDGLEGELAICDPRAVRGGGVAVRVDGRELELVDPGLSVPVEAVIGTDALQPRDDYRGVRRGDAFDAAMRAVEAATVVACEALALRLEGEERRGDRAEVRADWIVEAQGDDRARLRSLLRRGIALAVRPVEASLAPDAAPDALAGRLRRARSPLWTCPIWPTLGGDPVSTRALLREASRTPRVVAFVPRERLPADPPPPPGERRVLVLSRDERELLSSLIGPAALVDYEPALRAGPAPALAEAVRPGGAGLLLEGHGWRAIVSWGEPAASYELRHWGRTLSTLGYEASLAPCRVVVDDERLVPGRGWDGVRGDRPVHPLADWEGALARAFARALGGTAVEGLVLGAERAADARAARFSLLRSIARAEAEPEAWLGEDVVRGLRRVPWVRRLGIDAPVTLDALEAELDDDAPLVHIPERESWGLEAARWNPVVGPPEAAEAFARLLGREVKDGTPRVARIRRAARRRAALEAHRRQRAIDVEAVWPDDGVTLTGRGFEAARATFGLDAGSLQSEVELLIEARPFGRWSAEGLPLRAKVDLPQTAADPEFAKLGEAARRRMRRLVVRAARALLRKTLRETPAALVASPRARRLLGAWLEAHGDAKDRGTRSLREELANAAMFPTVQGGRAALADATTEGGALRVATWDADWLGPAEGERASAYDRPVLQLPAEEGPAKDRRALLERLVGDGSIRDVSAAVGRLQAARRVARGLAERPRLPAVKDARFRYALEDLFEPDDPDLEALGLGEAALAEGTRSRVLLFEHGEAGREVDANLIPRVEIAAQSPLVTPGRPLAPEAREAIEDAMRSVISRLVRKVVDDTPPAQLPLWVRRALRESCLTGGTLHYARLYDTPLFETTVGEWVSPARLRDQVERHGDVWWTGERAIDWAPLDPARLALVLTRFEVQELGEWVRLTEATEELALDREARENLARPPVESLDPTAEERAAAVAVRALEAAGGETGRGTVVVLEPGSAHLRALHVSRDRHPLGSLPDPARWPACARIDEPALAPDRTWSGPADDDALQRLMARVRSVVDRAMAELLPGPEDERTALRVRSEQASELGLPNGCPVEGVVWLEQAPSAGRVVWRGARATRELVPERSPGGPLPVSGELWLGAEVRARTVHRALARLYETLLGRLVARARSERGALDEGVRRHVLHGLAAGVRPEGLDAISLPCFFPEPWSLEALVAHVDQLGIVLAAPPDRVEAASQQSDAPVLVQDGSPLARQVGALLGRRLVPWQDALRARVLGDEPLGAVDPSAGRDPARQPRLPVPVGVPEAAAGATAGERSRPTERRASPLEEALGAGLERLALGTVREVRVDGRRKTPAVRVLGEVLWFAGKHPAVRAAREAVRTDAPHADALLRLLLARAAGALRGRGTIGVGGELGLLVDLLA